MTGRPDPDGDAEFEPRADLSRMPGAATKQTSAEVLERFKAWQARQRAVADLPRLEAALADIKQARAAAAVKESAARSVKKARKRARREDRAWSAALKATRLAVGDLNAEPPVAALIGFAVYAEKGGRLNFEGWQAELVSSRRRP